MVNLMHKGSIHEEEDKEKGEKHAKGRERERTATQLRDLPKRDMPGLQAIPRGREVPRVLARGLGGSDLEEVEALEVVRTFSDRFDRPSRDVRPCVAYIFLYGVSERRDDAAFALANELHCLDLGEQTILEALGEFNSRLSEPLPVSRLSDKVRRLARYKVNKPHSCNNAILSSHCVGGICPWRKYRNENKKPIYSELCESPWRKELTPTAFAVLLGLYELRAKRGLPPNATLVFNYSQLEEATGLTRYCFSRHLQTLNDYGLISNLEVGNTWGTGRGQGTKLNLVFPLPPLSGRGFS